MANTAALIVVKNKIPTVGNASTTDHDHDKYITTQEFNKLTWEKFAVRLKQVNLASKSDADTLKRSGETEKIVSWKSRGSPDEKFTIPTIAAFLHQLMVQ